MKKTSQLLYFFALLLMSQMADALTPKPAERSQKSMVFNNANIHVGDGTILKNATMVINNGKISEVGYFRRAWQKSDIDLKGKHVYPGFILPITELGLTEVNAVKATRDNVETGQVNPNVRSIVAYNTDSEIIPTLRFNGILLAQPTPQGGLVSGLSSIVQLDAWNWEDAAVIVDDAVHVNWPSDMKTQFDFSTFRVKTAKNKDYAKQLNQIKSLFEDAQSRSDDQKSDYVNLKLDAVSPVFKGKRKVYIHTSSPKAIVESVSFFKEVGVNDIVLVVGQNAVPVIGFIQSSGVPVIVNSSHSLPARKDSSIDAGYDVAVKLHNAGVVVALAYNSDSGVMSARNLAFTAGTVANYGVDKEHALQMITGNTAKILGLDDKYGTLSVGKSATFFISEGDALDMRTNIITEAFIDGRKIELQGRQQELYERFSEKYKNNKQDLKKTVIKRK